jgi:exonuclease SbcC
MRPHRLRVQAFGAFAGTEQVIFDDLEGLFLLHGETGAGKTTLLDAIAFALYGKVPGERGSAKRLRSDHAAPGLPTEVELEAAIGDRYLRITRKPEQERPSQRKTGTGIARDQASVRLEERTAAGTWELKSARIVEADQEIKDLMGMSADQFFQVVLLPQGQFAKFLQADARDKEALLRKLFATDRFAGVEAWLADRRRSTADDVKKTAEAVDVFMARIAQAAGVAVPPSAPALPGESPAERWQAAWAAGLAASAAARRDDAADLVAAGQRRLEETFADKTRAEKLADRQRRRREALRRQADLAAATPAVERLRAEADAAARAAEVTADLDAAARAAAAARTARLAEQQARAAIPAELTAPAGSGPAAGQGAGPDQHVDPDGTPAVLRDAAPEQLRSAADDQHAHLGRLDALRAVERQANAEDKASADARARAATLEAALGETRAAAAHRIEARPQAAHARDAASQALAEMPGTRIAADAARDTATDSAALVKERAKRDRLHEAHLTAREKAIAAQAAALAVREARIDGMRAELAATMTDGSPCPVCGSLDHPDPVESTFAPVSPDAEDAASALASRAAAEAEKAGREVAAAEARIGELAHRLAQAGFGALDVGAKAGAADPVSSALTAAPATLADAARLADADAKRLEADATRLAARAATLSATQRDLESLDEAIARDQARLVELAEQRSAAVDEAEAATRRAQDRRAELRAQLGDAPDLEAALRAARHLAAALTAAADAADETVREEAGLLDAGRRAVRAAIGAGFGTAVDADAAGTTNKKAPGADAAIEDAAIEDAAIEDAAIEDAAIEDAAIEDAAIEAARTACRNPAWRREAADRIKHHEADTEAVATMLADPDVDVPLDPPAPVAEKTAAANAAQQAHSAATSAHATATHTADQLAQLRPGLEAKLAELAPLRDRADQARQLADLAAGLGANQYKMTLSSFVLAARLEEVAAAASERLLTMTAGRYSLAHSDARKGNSRAGLSLLACDSWTGIDRDTATLSGGETFLASLALALGLADVVTAEAAGTPMEALFVDEGFGTLDEDTLDEVMNVLDGLREGGRIVGIVSHVAELRQRIPSRIHVAKTRHGSHVTISAS